MQAEEEEQLAQLLGQLGRHEDPLRIYPLLQLEQIVLDEQAEHCEGHCVQELLESI